MWLMIGQVGVGADEIRKYRKKPGDADCLLRYYHGAQDAINVAQGDLKARMACRIVMLCVCSDGDMACARIAGGERWSDNCCCEQWHHDADESKVGRMA